MYINHKPPNIWFEIFVDAIWSADQKYQMNLWLQDSCSGNYDHFEIVHYGNSGPEPLGRLVRFSDDLDAELFILSWI